MFTPTEKEGITYYSALFHENYNYRNHTDTSVEVFVVGGSKLIGYRHRFNSVHKVRVGGDMHDYINRVQQSMIKTLSKQLVKESLPNAIPAGKVESLYYNQSENLVDWLPTLEVITDEEGNSKVRVKI